MDVVAGLTALSQALTIAKDLREIGRTYDESTYKLKMSELQSALADAKVSLSDAKVEIASSTEVISRLEKQIDVLENGDFCPKCRTGRMELMSTEFHTMHGLGHFGVEDWRYRCGNAECGFEQKRLHDPHGAVLVQARKR